MAKEPFHKTRADGLQSFLQDVELDEKFSEQLMKIRNGSSTARKQAQRDLIDTKRCAALLEAAMPMFNECGLPELERTRLVKVLCRVLEKQPSLGSHSPICSQLTSLLTLIRKLLDSKNVSAQREEALPLLLNMARIAGMKAFLTALRPTFNTDDDNMRHSNATCIAAAAQIFGIGLTLPLVKVLVKSSEHKERLLGLLIVQRLPRYLSMATLPHLNELVHLCAESLKDPFLSNPANSALTTLADTVTPFGIEAFESLLGLLWSGARRRRGRPKISFLRTLSSIVSLASSDTATELANPILEIVLKLLSSEESVGEYDELRRVLGIARKCVPYADNSLIEKFVPVLFGRFWTPDMAYDRRVSSEAVWTALELPLSRTQLITSLVNSNSLTSESFWLRVMALELLAKSPVKPILLDSRTEERLIDGLINALPEALPETEENGMVEIGSAEAAQDPQGHLKSSYVLAISVKAVSNVLKALPEEKLPELGKLWTHTLLLKQSYPSYLARQNAAGVLASIAPLLPQAQLQLIWRRFYEELGEEYPEVLATVIDAIRFVLGSLDLSSVSLDPSLTEVLPRLTPILRNRHDKVQESCIKLIHSILKIAGDDISAREWMQVCFELLELQKSQRQQVRFEATAAFAAISAVVGPADVVGTLINHLRSPDRQFRVTTAAAIASVAVETGPFTVLPVLMNEYRIGESVVQQGVLKTLAFMFEFLAANKALPYLDSLSTLLDDALVDRSQVHRQTAASVVHYLARNCIGSGKEVLFIHFLNELMPSIFETSPHVIDRVAEAIGSIQQLIGAPAFLNYIWAGLFHPARKVRNIYWRLWNLQNNNSPSASVPTCPISIPDPLLRTSDIRDVWF